MPGTSWHVPGTDSELSGDKVARRAKALKAWCPARVVWCTAPPGTCQARFPMFANAVLLRLSSEIVLQSNGCALNTASGYACVFPPVPAGYPLVPARTRHGAGTEAAVYKSRLESDFRWVRAVPGARPLVSGCSREVRGAGFRVRTGAVKFEIDFGRVDFRNDCLQRSEQCPPPHGVRERRSPTATCARSEQGSQIPPVCRRSDDRCCRRRVLCSGDG